MANPTPSTNRATQTGDAALDILLSGFHWTLGPDRTIDWSVSGGPLGETWPQQTAMVTAVGKALASLAAFIDVKFNYLGYFSDPAAAAQGGAEINVAPSRNPAVMADSVLATARYPRAPDGAAAGDVLVNLNSIASEFSYEPGASGFFMLVHELSHALGLKHTFEDDGAGRLSIEDTRFKPFDADWFSAMSYNDPYQTNRLQFEPSTPLGLDVVALQHLYGPNLAAGAGDSLYRLAADDTYRSLWDASGDDTVSVEDAPVGWDIALLWDRFGTTPVGLAQPIARNRPTAAYAIDWLVGAFENVVGSAFSDKVFGSAAANRIEGGGGNDIIDGFQGRDTAVYQGASTDFSWFRGPDGISWTVSDLRWGSPEGVDILRRIEVLSFLDRDVELTPRLSAPLERAFRMILRADGYAPANAALAEETVALPTAEAVARLVQAADATTSVVTLTYQFFTGRLPSEPTVDALVGTTFLDPAGLNGDAYQAMSLENRYIDFAVRLAKSDAGQPQFEPAYDQKSLLDTVKLAYQIIFGAAPTDAKAHALLDSRAGYFAAYGGDGPNGLGTKAAAIGWLLSEAAKADVGTLQTANIKFLTDLADGAPFAVDLVGTYGGTPFLEPDGFSRSLNPALHF